MLKNKYQILPHTTHDKADEAKLIQTKDEAIDAKDWLREEEYGIYPHGARAKSILSCPLGLQYGFLIDGHRYLFKRSSHRYIEQYWMEIFAYRLGIAMDIQVPPAFVAFDSKRGYSGSLIEWFIKINGEDFISGGELFRDYIPNFDRKKGRLHNFNTISQIFDDLTNKNKFQLNWKYYWAKILTFDAIIGNTDRHQENWGIIKNIISSEIHFAPVFDNGTSLGCEISSDNFKRYGDIKYLEKYVSKGWHHMKWSLSEPNSMGHLELLQRLGYNYPETKSVMLNCLSMVNKYTFENILQDLVAFNVSVRLSFERADFMLKLLQLRHQRLINGLEKKDAFY